MDKEKQKIIRTFNRAAQTYDKACHIQYLIGNKLIKMAAHHLSNPNELMDIGCGTGLITVELKQCFPDTNLTALDLADNLLNQARSRPTLANVKFVQSDLDHLPFANASCPSIFSNMALQWSMTPEATVKEWARILRPGGYLIFSIPVSGTFHELVTTRCQLGQAVNPINTQDPETFCQYLSQADLKLHWLTITHQTYYYPSMIALIRAIKHTGANHIPGQWNAPMTGKRYLQRLQAAYPKAGQYFPLSYRIAMFIAQRSAS